MGGTLRFMATGATLSEEDRAAAARFIAAARGEFGDRLLKTVLYGSKARGDAHPESDLDLLMILRGDAPVDWQDARAASFLAADIGPRDGRGHLREVHLERPFRT